MGFTPVQTLLGGILLHVSTSSLLTETGRVFGVSGVVDGAFFGDHAKWRWAVIAGLLGGPAITAATGLSSVIPDTGTSIWAAAPLGRLALAGALVGFGAKMGSGCTSGHMLCGMSRLSPRSIVATCTFFVASVLVAKLFPAKYIVDTVPAYAPSYPPSWALPGLAGLIVAALVARKAVEYIIPRCLDGECEDPRSSSNNASNGNSSPSTTTNRATESWLSVVPYLVSSLTFSVGLVVSGMVSPMKVMGFLRVPPPADLWDPSLGLIMVGGVLPNAIQWANIKRRSRVEGDAPEPMFRWEEWRVPSRRDINPRLVAGALAFGLGWGLCGVCPGPAITTAGGLAVNAFQGQDVSVAAKGWATFCANMVFGMFAARGVEKALA